MTADIRERVLVSSRQQQPETAISWWSTADSSHTLSSATPFIHSIATTCVLAILKVTI